MRPVTFTCSVQGAGNFRAVQRKQRAFQQPSPALVIVTGLLCSLHHLVDWLHYSQSYTHADVIRYGDKFALSYDPSRSVRPPKVLNDCRYGAKVPFGDRGEPKIPIGTNRVALTILPCQYHWEMKMHLHCIRSYQKIMLHPKLPIQ